MCDFDEKNEKINIDWIDWCVCYQSRRKKKKNFEECYTINDEEKYEFIKPSEKPKNI